MNLVSSNYSKFTNFFTYLIIIIYCKISKVKNANSLNNDFIEYEQKLLANLFKNYDPLMRPSGTVQVKFALNLLQIVEILEKEQVMVINAFIDHKWIDPRMAWGKRLFNLLAYR